MFTSINKTAASLIVILVMGLFSVNSAHASENRFNLEGRVGIAIPIGDFDRFIADAGFATGLKVS